MKIIAGLGNPGAQYDDTPHNAGFVVVDLLAKRFGLNWKVESRFNALTTDLNLEGSRVVLMKPLTYMNLSGQAVAAYIRKNGGEPDEVLAISDDIHLPFGTLRLRPNGSHGGQKGLLSIMQSLGTMEFPRLRVGIKPDTEIPTGRLPDYVLGKIKPAHRDAYAASCERAADAVEHVIKHGVVAAMDRYNRKA